MEQWYKDQCPQCRKPNWINNGDPQDMTAFDVEGIKCWNCGHCWKLGNDDEDEVELRRLLDEDQDDPRFELGRHFEEVRHEE